MRREAYSVSRDSCVVQCLNWASLPDFNTLEQHCIVLTEAQTNTSTAQTKQDIPTCPNSEAMHIQCVTAGRSKSVLKVKGFTWAGGRLQQDADGSPAETTQYVNTDMDQSN